MIQSNLLVLLVICTKLKEGLADVGKDFARCNRFFYERQDPVGFMDKAKKKIKHICQEHGNKKYSFATLYDTESKIPIYSGYTLGGNGVIGNAKMADEVGVKSVTADTHHFGGARAWKHTEQLDADEEASAEDYQGSLWGKGYLSPRSYQKDKSAKKTTYTLTNAVPQHPSLNMIYWKALVADAQKIMEVNCQGEKENTAFFITGAIPSVLKSLKGEERVSIPSSLYTAACCQRPDGDDFSFAYIVRNQAKPDIKIETVNRLAEIIMERWPKDYYYNVKDLNFFNGGCGAEKEDQINILKEMSNERKQLRFEDEEQILRSKTNGKHKEKGRKKKKIYRLKH